MEPGSQCRCSTRRRSRLRPAQGLGPRQRVRPGAGAACCWWVGRTMSTKSIACPPGLSASRADLNVRQTLQLPSNRYLMLFLQGCRRSQGSECLERKASLGPPLTLTAACCLQRRWPRPGVSATAAWLVLAPSSAAAQLLEPAQARACRRLPPSRDSRSGARIDPACARSLWTLDALATSATATGTAAALDPSS